MSAQHFNRRPVHFWIELSVILLAGVLIAWPLRGHFVKPHIDFFDFNDAADALLTSPLESSHKRGPVYPALLAIGGGALRACGVVDPPPRQVFAEWMNFVLLPCNGVLVYLLALRWLALDGCSSGLAAWIAAAFLILPLSLAMTAHLLVEPLLTAMILLTILAASSKRMGFAYFCASLAILTRYDAAGLLLGLVATDLVGRRTRVAIVGGIAAMLPLILWLGLTAMQWDRELDQHYLQQIAARPRFDLLWSSCVILDACFSPGRIPLPAWIDLDEGRVRFGFRLLLTALACAGVWRLARSRDRAALTAIGCAAAYIFVHAVFPFQWDRFGYPITPLMLAAAGVGAGWMLQAWLSAGNRIVSHAVVRCCLCGAVLLLFVILSIGVVQATVDARAGGRAGWFLRLLGCVAPLVALLVAVSGWRRMWAEVMVGAFLLCWFVPLQLREADPILGTGREREGLVQAARWIAANCGPDEVVLSDQVGLLRLYAPDRRDKFLALWQIEAEHWPDIVAECRKRGVRKIMWHSAVYEEHAHEAYAGWWRVERFAGLDGPTRPSGVRLTQSILGDPNVSILEVDAP